MKLVHLSIASVAGCIVGLLLLAAAGLHGFQGIRAKQAEVAELQALEKRIDGFSVASDSLLLFDPDPALWRSYRAEAKDIQARLRGLGPEYPHARNAAGHIDLILESVGRVIGENTAREEPPADDGEVQADAGRLGISARGRVILNQVAGHGVALDTAFDNALGARQRAIARDSIWIAATFAGAAGLFGALCVVAFGLIHRRISGPIRSLAGAIERIREGHLDGRARVTGSDELADLSREFNRLMERRQADEARLNQYRHLIEGSGELYAIFDAEYRYVLVNRFHAERFAMERADVEGSRVADVLGHDQFQHQVKPALDRALAGQTRIFEARRAYPGLGVRDVLIRYFPIESPGGGVGHVGAVITDITDLKQTQAELDHHRHLLDIAGRAARLGGWSVDLQQGVVVWSDVVAEIHGRPHGYSPTVEEGIGFYAPEWRATIRERFTACVERGQAYDEELEIITADHQRRWVRAVGEPVRDEQGRIVRVQGAFQDISARKAVELERNRLAAQTRAILESITDAFFALDEQWCFAYVNPAAESLLERSSDELLGKNLWSEFPEAAGTRIEREYRRAVAERVTVSLEEYYPPLGKWLDIRAYPTDDGLAVYFQDSTERHWMLEILRDHEKSLRASRDELERSLEARQALINSLPAHIALLDGEGEILDVNEQWRNFGRNNDISDAAFGVGMNYFAVCDNASGEWADGAREFSTGLAAVLAARRDSFAQEYPCHSPDEQRWFRVMVNRLVMQDGDDESYGAVVMHVDITERKLAEQELNRLAYQDPLTDLPSRSGFVRTVGKRLAAAEPALDGLIVSLNIRGMHDINEAHGFAAGDQLLRQVGARLGACAGDGAVVGRAGGDDFVVFLPEAASSVEPRRVEELAAAFAETFDLGQARVEAAARFGHTRVDFRRHPVEDMLRESSLALSHTRDTYAGIEVTAYTRALDEQAQRRVRTNTELRQALENQEFELNFQPKVELESGRLVSCEALLRWRHPQRGLVPPGEFIPYAEQSQFIAPIGDWVVNEACRLIRQWQDAGLRVVRVSINVSLVQLMIGDFTQTVREALGKHGVPASSLSLEITESVFEEHSDRLVEQMKALHDMGLYLSLDDFGTGYSSLLYLQRYPFDEIKIDQGFVRDLLTDPYSPHIVTTVQGVAAAIGADVIAEGVETKQARDKLLELGCRFGQGYYYSRPLEAGDFQELLARCAELPLQGVGGA